MSEHLPARRGLWHSVHHYFEKEALAAFFVGVSSGFPYAMIGATLTTRLAQDGIKKSTVTAFSLAFLAYNLKFLWAWLVDGVRLPIIGRLGQRVSWMLFAGVLVIAAVTNLALADPTAGIGQMAVAAILVAVAGATYDIVIDAYRIEILKPEQLGTGSGMSQYGWRIGSAGAAALALVVAGRHGWHAAYIAALVFALPAMITALVLGEPARHVVHNARRGLAEAWNAFSGPFIEFFRRHGAWLVLLFILVHKIGDTLSQLTVRLLFNDLGFTNDEIATWDVGVGFWAYLVGIFIGGALYERLGLKRSVLLALVLMGVSNFSFALLAAGGHSNYGLAAAIGFENAASGYGGVVVVAYFSALANLQFTAAQYALISAAASVVGRVVTGTMAGQMIEAMGFVGFYVLTAFAALPGILLFWYMMRTGLVDRALGDAGKSKAGNRHQDMSTVLPAGTLLGRLAELPDGATREFALSESEWPLTGFLVRVGSAVHAYLNRCPHALRQLNFLPDRFLNADRTLIQCSSHGALFELDTGMCVAGPCVGESLRRLPIALADGEVRLTEDLDITRLDRNPFLP